MSDKHISMEKRAEQYVYFIWCFCSTRRVGPALWLCVALSFQSHSSASSSLKYSFIEYFNKPENFPSRFPFRLCINTLGKWEKFLCFWLVKKKFGTIVAFCTIENSSWYCELDDRTILLPSSSSAQASVSSLQPKKDNTENFVGCQINCKSLSESGHNVVFTFNFPFLYIHRVNSFKKKKLPSNVDKRKTDIPITCGIYV